jgi:hypothetical protein
MEVVLNILDHPDPCSLVVLIGLLAWVGNVMTRNISRVRTWGEWACGAAFVGYCIYAIWTFAPVTAGEFLEIVIRGLFAAGLTLGFSWVVLASAVFVYANTLMRVQYEMRRRANRRFHEEKEQILLQLRMARKDLELPAITTVVEEPVTKTETIRETIVRERSDHEDRVAAINELKASGVIDEEMREELQTNELERFTRRLTDVLGYRTGEQAVG